MSYIIADEALAYGFVDESATATFDVVKYCLDSIKEVCSWNVLEHHE